MTSFVETLAMVIALLMVGAAIGEHASRYTEKRARVSKTSKEDPRDNE